MDDDKQWLANLGRAFREARERAGLSEREVAHAVRGISLAGVRAIEAGERPSLNEQMIRLARVLGVEASEIIGQQKASRPCGLCGPQRQDRNTTGSATGGTDP